MKVVILAGGLGTRISEETSLKPKPMIEIGGKPILWHIMKVYSYYGFNEFIILCGYKGFMIKEYFKNYYSHMSDMTIDLKTNKIEYHKNQAEPWKITLVDTDLDTMTGGRIRRIKNYIGNNTFMLTYGDGIGNINIKELLNHHKKYKKYITITSARPGGRFGNLKIEDNNKITSFQEKPKDSVWINAGFMVCEPEVFNFLENDSTIFEQYPLSQLALDNQMMAFKHQGFWKPMDTLKDKNDLNKMWIENPKWKIW